MKKLPLGIQNFGKIIEGDYIYVDKTQHIYNLLNDASYYFLSRPRRFGKSLLIDTIAEVFGGDKELFKGLWIYDSDYAFKKHPVIRLDLSSISNETPEVLKKSIISYIKNYYSDEGFDPADSAAGDAFRNLIYFLYQKYDERVVVLIDEYDKPILDHMDDIGIAKENRKVLRGFYGILKSMDPYLKMAFITGVSKFTKTSVFSDLNNLYDITLQKKYAGICGIPIECIDEYFGGYIDQLSSDGAFRLCDSIKNEILSWYDGYSWDGTTKLLNPFSLLNFFAQGKFRSYWYATGTPWFMIEMLKNKPETYLRLKNLKVTEEMLEVFDVERIEIEPLLFQTGYLTVKESIERIDSPIYILDISNYEVRDALNMQIVSALTESGDVLAGQAHMEISRALESGDLQLMLDMLRGLFASIPYELHVKEEAYYHSIFYAVMTLLGFDMDAEVSTSRGRIDAVLELDDKVFVMEFKYEKCPKNASAVKKMKLFDAALDNAMKQINNRGYCDKYRGSGKTIYKASFAFLGRDEIKMKVETEQD